MSENQKKHIAILGSTGSIGTQALEVIAANSDRFQVEVLTAHSNADLLAEQALKFKANAVVIHDESKYKALKDRLFDEGIKVFCGRDALAEVVEMETIDLVLTALVGFAGLKPTMRAIAAGKQIALANKETLVVAGELITKAAREKGVNIYPVDSEHSAIFQCLSGEFHNPIEKIYLTASGGPFRGMSLQDLKSVTPAQALKHPNWDMGAKITIDSASMMNKGLEVIEAKWLFGLKPEQIDIVVHPQSIIHSIVQFEDGSMKAQMGLPDMKLPIQYALGYPERIKSDFPRFDFMKYPQLTFEKPDYKAFRNLQFAFDAMQKGGNAPCVLNAANEIAVKEFLAGNIGFLAMSDLIEDCLQNVTYIAQPRLENYFETDSETRAYASSKISSL
ncbi:1-deoxy-D-xylulose-5-phosphate reductoisomerase [Cryomorpha ignava]|uniref:1-deoxy-D-xylulose 5-phosphate reductoisomerase n=1 Tax=Cryomorpha ignava TaxID=101383 RepID=A0A7K3WR37_9FLAO|nr:1-deoxy-D-xylulose-5-phosphate reductoisomerase [Cryomorpha ignava]NEN24140.1 1-deoxy-D-xylulose-5-phosphate reductoisomerase [Cryomorpha ignava]